MSSASRIAAIFACLTVAACAGETQERPSRTEPIKASNIAPADEESAHPESRTVIVHDETRFKTRTIGHESGDGRRPFRGAPVDLDVKDANLHDVFRLIADVGKVNIVVAGEVTGTITLKLKRVPWDQAFDVIVRAKGLTYEREGNVLLVRTLSGAAK